MDSADSVMDPTYGTRSHSALQPAIGGDDVAMPDASHPTPVAPPRKAVTGTLGLDSETDGWSHESALAVALLMIGLAASVVMGWRCGDGSGNGLLHYDDLTHYLYAKWSWTWPAYLVDQWGRPGFTVPYALPAWISWRACRILSAILTAAAAWLAFRIARQLGLRNAWAVVALAYVQPLFFLLSQTTLTETPLAFYLTLAIWWAIRNRWSLSAAVLSVAFVTRHESIIFLPIWIILARRQGAGLFRWWPLLWAPLVVNLFAWVLGVRPAIETLLNPEPSTQYGHGGWLTFFARSLHAWGPGIAILAMIGLPATLRRRGGDSVVWCIVAFFGVQTILRALGLYASGGYARFLVPISPLVAIAALAGWGQLWSREAKCRRVAIFLAGASMVVLWLALERQLKLNAGRDIELPEIHQAVALIRISAYVIVALVAVALLLGRSSRWIALEKTLLPVSISVLIILGVYGLHRPLRLPAEAKLIQNMRSYLDEENLAGRQIITANIWLDHVLDHAWPPNRPSLREELEKAPIGTLFAWERQFAASEDHKLHADTFLQSPSFRMVHRTAPRSYEEEPYMMVFQKIGDWKPESTPSPH